MFNAAILEPAAALACFFAALACGACGGTVDAANQDPQGAFAPAAPDPGPSTAPADDTNPQAPTHFVCRIPFARSPVDLDCGTLFDGGASYYDTSAHVDCRIYMEGAAQGCIPDMDCHAYVEVPSGTDVPSGVFQLASGVCVDPSK